MRYTAEQMVFLSKNATMNQKDLTVLFNEKFSTDKSYNSIRKWCLRNGFKRDFKQYPPRINDGAFKKGSAPVNEMKLGQEYIHPKTKVVMIKTEAGRVPKHYVVWGEPVPKGYVLMFKDGNKLNITKENLMLMTKAEHLRYNQRYARIANTENNETCLLLAKLRSAKTSLASTVKPAWLISNDGLKRVKPSP